MPLIIPTTPRTLPATSYALHKLREMIDTMIVQREERSLETSVNKLLFAGSRMSVFPSGAFRL
jgi:hypothetical protein